MIKEGEDTFSFLSLYRIMDRRLFVGILLLTAVCYHPGRAVFSQEKIRVGASLPLSGEMAIIGKDYLKGAEVYVRYINENGGVGGREIKIVARDDNYNPRLCAENTLNLIKEDNVFALFCYGGSSTTMYALPIVSSNKVPLIGILSGVTPLRDPFNPYIINIRAPLSKEVDELIKNCMVNLGIEKIGIFYQFDVLGSDGLNAAEEVVFKYSNYTLHPVIEASYPRGSKDVAKGVESIKQSGAKAVLLLGEYKPLASFIKMCRMSGYAPLFLTVSNVGAEVLASEIKGLDNVVVIVSQVVPSLTTDDLAAVKDYKTFLHKYFPDEMPTSIGLEGFINARVLVEGLKSSGAKKREDLIRAIEEMNDFDVGIDQKVSFGQGDHQGFDNVYFIKIVNGKITPLKDWSSLKGFVP